MKITYLITPNNFPSKISDSFVFLYDEFYKNHDIKIINLNNELWKNLADYQFILGYVEKNKKTVEKIEDFNIEKFNNGINNNKTNLKINDYFFNKGKYRDEIFNLYDKLKESCKLDENLAFYFSLFYYEDITFLDNAIIANKLNSIKDKIVFYFFNKVLIDNDVFQSDLILMDLSSFYSIFFAVMISHIIKSNNKNFHICINNHFYENFTLNKKYIIENKQWLFSYFDSIIIDYKNREITTKKLIESLQNSISLDNLNNIATEKVYNNKKKIIADQSVIDYCKLDEKLFDFPFQPYPIMSLRISDNICHWNKCTFCIQNIKYHKSGKRINIKADIDDFISKVTVLIKDKGIKHYILTDEALKFNDFIYLCNRIIENKLDIIWCARMTLSKKFLIKENIIKLQNAGCREILFGMESFDKKTLHKMNKIHKNLPYKTISMIIDNFVKYKVGVHLSMIIGFPGQKTVDVINDLNKIYNILLNNPLITVTLNNFALFKESIISKKQKKFKVTIEKNNNNITNVMNWKHDINRINIDKVNKLIFNIICKILNYDNKHRFNKYQFLWDIINNSGQGLLLKEKFISDKYN